MAPDEQRWVVAPDQARIDIAIGPEATLSPELRAALEHLASVLEGADEVQGYLMNPVQVECGKVTTTSCAILMQCSSVVYSG